MHKTSRSKKLTLHRETVRHLDDAVLYQGFAAGTLTHEGSCGQTFCPCPSGQSDCCPTLA